MSQCHMITMLILFAVFPDLKRWQKEIQTYRKEDLEKK